LAFLHRKYSELIQNREEGIVLKPDHSIYLGYHQWFKLKKDYIPGHGDLIDCCIVGAGYDAVVARRATRQNVGVKYNIWHIGFLTNKSGVLENVPPPLG
jgi:DNA ligase 4